MTRLSLLFVLLIDACRTPTAMTVHVLSDVPCAAQRGVTVVAAGPGEYESAPPTGQATRCEPVGNGLYDMGRIVVTPKDDGSDRIGIRAVVGVSRDAEACTTANNFAGCIVSRRLLHYVPHTELTIRLVLRQECEGIACGPDTTCVGRVCKGAAIEPTRCENGCGEEVLSDRCDTPGKVECTGGKRVTCLPNRTRKVEDCGLSCSATTCLAASNVIAVGSNDEMGGGTSCALVAGDVYCWGSNLLQRAGVTAVSTVSTPTKLTGMPRIVEVAAGGTAVQIYARDDAGGVWCWGEADSGQCGAPEVLQTTPRRVVDDMGMPLTGITRVATGSLYGCVINAAGDVLCTGQNGLGQLGRGTMGDKSMIPRAIDRSLWKGRATELACMTNTCCVLDDKGSVACFGNNDAGQVGAGKTDPVVAIPTPVTLERPVRALRAGDQNICALLDDGGVACWGAPNRSIFIDTNEPQRSPRRLRAFDGKEVIALATGMPRGHYAITKSGTVLGWGTDGLHVGAPDGVPSLTGATSIGIASAHGCAVIAGGLQCWGLNTTGQLGDSSAGHPTPTPVTWK
jgi:alpha-tubulin suppressor-like RCC1 family protein